MTSSSRRFQLLGKLGEGAQGVVYEAYDTEREMRVAVKMLRRVDSAAISSLRREFRALRSLSHPNIVTLYELLSEDGDWFLTMELIEGQDLVSHVRVQGPRDRMPSGSDAAAPPGTSPEPSPEPPGDKLDVGRLRQTLAQLAQALHAIHVAGLVHRDVKPGNVRVTPLGRAVLMDFSSAAPASDDSEPLGSGDMPAGTPAYMAPEQAAGEPASPTADWYSLGVVLYEALTGQLPFVGTPTQVLVAKQSDEPPRPSRHCGDVPPDLDGLCAGLLARKPENRLRGEDVLRHLGVAADTAANFLQGRGEGAFVGRTRELTVLATAARRAAEGELVAVVVSAPSGMGKSTLIRHFMQNVNEAAGAPVITVTGRVHPCECAPFGAVDELADTLSRTLLELPKDRLAAILPPDAALLTRMFPAFRRVADIPLAPPPAMNPHELRSRTIDALRTLLYRLADWRGVVLSVDDLQWADRDSLLLLEELLATPARTRLLLVVAVRSAADMVEPALPAPIATLMARIAGQHPLERIVLGPLRKADEAGLLGRQALGSQQVESPLHLTELARFLAESPDAAASGRWPTLDQILSLRIQALPDEARVLLEAAALAATPAPLSLLAEAVDLRPGERERSTATLRAARLLRVERAGRDPWLTTYHESVREEVLARLGHDRYRELNERLAHAFARWERRSDDVLAYHWQRAGEPAQALAYLVPAAENALGRLAYSRAGTLYSTALGLGGAPERPSLLVDTAHALALAGRSREAADIYLRAAAVADDDAPELRRRAAAEWVKSGDVQAGLGELITVTAELGRPLSGSATGAGERPEHSARPERAISEPPRSRLLNELSAVFDRARLSARSWRRRRRDESDVAPRDLARVDTLRAIGLTVATIDYNNACILHRRHALAALIHGERRRVCRAAGSELMYLAARGGRHLERALALAGTAISDAAAVNDPYSLGLVHLGAGIAHVAAEQYPAAETSLSEAVRIFAEETSDSPWELLVARYFDIVAVLQQGRLAEAAPLIERALAQAQRAGDVYARALFAGRPNLWRLLRLDRADEALEYLDESTTAFVDGAPCVARYLIEAARVSAHLYSGDSGAARRALVECERLMQSLELQRIPTLASERQALATRIAMLDGDQAALARAARMGERARTPLARGNTALLSAALMQQEGRGERVVQLLERAIDHFKDAGAHHFVMSAKFRLGRAIGSNRGNELRAKVEEWCTNEGIANHERMFAYLTPWPSP